MSVSNFVAKSACRGHRPSQFVAFSGNQRPRLIARLAKERHTARFIVAPAGFGKTSLALGYAEMMFSWVHVFWVNAGSPCFIRDLDAGVIGGDCLACDADAKLVVIDDLPSLDAARSSRLSEEIDFLIGRGCEVIVICAPTSDSLGQLQRDRLRISAADLLLDDDELDVIRSQDDRAHIPSSNLSPSSRVPALAWSTDPSERSAFVSQSLSEDLPSDLQLMICSMFVLHAGSLSALKKLGLLDSVPNEEIMADYPHLEIDVEADRFSAPLIDIDETAAALRRKLVGLARRAAVETRGELVCAWAEILMSDTASVGRACDIMRVFGVPQDRANWVFEKARTLMRCGCFLPWLKLVMSMRNRRFEGRARLAAHEAVCRKMLGDENGAILSAKRCAFERTASSDARVIGLLILARHAAGVLRENAALALSEWAAPFSSGLPPFAWWDALAVGWQARSAGIVGLSAMWSEMKEAEVDPDVLCVVASWLYDLIGQACDRDEAVDRALLAEPEKFVRSQLVDEDEVCTDHFAIFAGLAMEGAHMKGMAYCGGALESSLLLGLRRAEIGLLSQRQAFARELRTQQAQTAEAPSIQRILAAEKNGLLPTSSQRAVPTLELRLFGRFDVSIGGVPVEAKRFNRLHTRVLLVLLAAARGRDVSRESIIEAMWPASDPEIARKNFYTVWSQLKRALTLADGTCPYLVRHQYGCHLEDRYVNSDLARLDDICRELLFGKVDFGEWLAIYKEIDRDFAYEMLPAESRNALIQKVRTDYRNRLVDALVTASQRLVDAGNPQWGIWFARTAVDREPTREDAHVALMRAQIAFDQRTAAMMTYLNCRRILSDELGIDPSPEMIALYDSLLGSA